MLRQILLAGSLLGWLQIAAAAELHIAPTGRDDNPGSATAPFASLERARDAARALLSGAVTGICMDGPGILNFALRKVPEAINNTLEAIFNGAIPMLRIRVSVDGASLVCKVDSTR